MLDAVPTLKNMTCKQLRELIVEAQDQLAAKTEEEIDTARSKIQAIVEETGINLKDLLPKRGRKKRQRDDTA